MFRRTGRDSLRRPLAGSDLEIVGEAADGREALSRIDSLRPDLVFLDIHMPSLSGLAVAARLRVPRPRIVFCTAFDRFAVDAFEHQAMDYMLKPACSDRLAKTVERVLIEIREQRRAARDLEEAVCTQAHLMPQVAPSVRGLDCAWTGRPARRVSGDYCDFLALDPDRVGIVLGDVSGKGRSPASSAQPFRLGCKRSPTYARSTLKRAPARRRNSSRS